MLAGVAESLAFDSELLDDLKTAVSEACNNVVLHAYGGEPGPLLVELMVSEVYVEVMVRDLGSGIQYVASDDRMGVGLAVISALAARAEFLSVPGGGTEVRMSFSRAGPGRQGLGRAVESEPGEEPPIRLSGDVVLTVTPVSLLTGSLGRLARAVAAGARFSLDRFSDVSGHGRDRGARGARRKRRSRQLRDHRRKQAAGARDRAVSGRQRGCLAGRRRGRSAGITARVAGRRADGGAG
jgi:hypothetical protein